MVVITIVKLDRVPYRCIGSMRRQRGMRLDERIIPYLQMAGLYHLARLNETWFRLHEPLVSAFVEKWRLETHTRSPNVGVVPGAAGFIASCEQHDKFTVRCSWMQDTFGEIPDGADNATVRRYAGAYIMMFLGLIYLATSPVLACTFDGCHT
ncbi:hypothetical protein Ahy_B05g074661 [Arachis hypogaea]|uniref:Aminotransferase-like plant mobile domain-containing protein n=1 Tax=Arachis hypogaea TaxID=3818 RepID=A0A444YZG8_ARAHY|nr:hypothetical protein Ahy_B05g074661 [Arachis hypogaea]